MSEQRELDTGESSQGDRLGDVGSLISFPAPRPASGDLRVNRGRIPGGCSDVGPGGLWLGRFSVRAQGHFSRSVEVVWKVKGA